MGITTRLALPYPELADRAIVPDDVRDLAFALDRAAIIDQGGSASRPVSTSASPGVRGRFYWATDESVLYHDTGTAWAAINPSLVTDGPAGTGSLRTLGTSGTSAAAGNDTRLSNQRVPTNASVTAAKVASTLLPSQGAGGAVEAMRAIGTAAGRVASGNDPRFPAGADIVDADVASTAAIAESKLAFTPGQLWEPGDVKQTTRSAAPPGWIKAIGVTLNRSTYEALWAVAQAEIAAGNAIYGAGNGSTTFTVADLSRRVLVGAGSAGGLSTRALGAEGGAETHTLTEAQLAAHDHSASQSSHSHSASQSAHGHSFIDDNGNYAAIKHLAGGNSNPGRNVATGIGHNGGDLRTNSVAPSVSIGGSGTLAVDVNNAGSGSSHNNMQPFVTVHTLIKT